MKNLLSLLQISDSALPIGSVAHSYGLETLIAEAYVDVDSLEAYLESLLRNSGKQDGWGCRIGYQTAQLADEQLFYAGWDEHHHTLSALRSSHELRAASEKIGRRLLQLIGQVEPHETIRWAWHSKQTHHAAVFGLIGHALEIDVDTMVIVFLQQLVKAQIGAAQKLLPLGQNQATQMMWRLKPIIEEVAAQIDDDLPAAFPGLTELASMRHPYLQTRLFIS